MFTRGRRAIVTAAFGRRPDVGKVEGNIGKKFSDNLERWAASFLRHDDSSLLIFRELPDGCPPHLENPYAFKAYALMVAMEAGFSRVLWADSSVYAVRSLSPLWDRIETDGYWLSKNAEWNCGQWTCDSALPVLGITREQAFSIPHVVGTSFGLNLHNHIGLTFLNRYFSFAKSGVFRGPWVNNNGEASSDRRVLGHRHDQTAASVIAHELGMKLTIQPHIISDYCGESEETILKVER